MRPIVLLGASLLLALGVWGAVAGDDTGVAGDAERTRRAVGATEGPVLSGAPRTEPKDPDTPAATDATPPRVVAGGAASPPVGTTYTLRGVVLDAGRRPLAVRIELNAITGGSMRYVTSDLTGRFAITNLPPDRYSVLARPSHTTIHRPKRLEVNVDADTDIEFVLHPYPYVDLLFVDAATGFGLRTTRMKIVVEQNGKAAVRMSTSTATQPLGEIAPFRYRWIRNLVDFGYVERLRVQALGYEPSAWIDAPTRPEPDPVRVPLRPDPGGVCHLVLVPRLDTGEDIPRITVWQIEGRGRNGQTHDLPEGGEVTLTLNPGIHRIGLGDWGQLPDDPRAWCVPQTFDIELARGETLRHIVTVQQGGFARVRGLGTHYTAVCTPVESGTVRTFALWTRNDEEGAFLAMGPLPPGAWTYAPQEHDHVLATGEVTIVAGQIVDSTPTVRSDPDDDE